MHKIKPIGFHDHFGSLSRGEVKRGEKREKKERKKKRRNIYVGMVDKKGNWEQNKRI